MVMLHHFSVATHFYHIDLIRNAWLFVDFFFVLSGFVIALNYKDRIAEGFSVPRFMGLRFGRIWPLHAFVLGLFVVAEIVLAFLPGLENIVGRDAFCTDWTQPNCDGQHTAETLAPNFFLLHALPGVSDNISWNGPSWSISTEFWTYLIFAAGVWIVSRLPKSDTLFTFAIVGLIVLCP
ncbi:MAG: acyltransferase, partial [Henriciella sp.]